MSRKLRAAVAQLGPIHLADSRAAVVKRLIALLREANGAGAKFVVFPELALTTFFPRWWLTDQTEIDRYFEREMPGPETRPLFDLAKEFGIGFYLGYAELTQEDGQVRHYNTSILVDPSGHVVGRYRKIHLPGHSEHLPQAPFQHLEKRYFDVGNEGFKVWRMQDTVMGMCICNDRRWPETYRVMGLQGVEIMALGRGEMRRRGRVCDDWRLGHCRTDRRDRSPDAERGRRTDHDDARSRTRRIFAPYRVRF
jgi:N-carbamoyl-D-amino-acid hydrolase